MKNGSRMTLEQRKRLSEAHKGIRPSVETRRKRSESMKGKNRYERIEETRKKLSEAHKGQIPWLKGKKHSEESKRKMSEAHKGRVPWNKGKHSSEETKKKLSTSHLGIKYPNRKYTFSRTAFQQGHKINLGRKFPAEFGKKIVETRRKNNSYIVSKETRKKQSESLRKTLSNPEVRKRLSESTKRGMSTQDVREKLREHRAKQIFPKKDSSPEIKIQDFLRQMCIEFLTHKYIKQIEHGYQCDIFIPSRNLIIECDGNYWHKYPNGREIDKIRTNELISKGFNVLRLWESEINEMDLQKFVKSILPFPLK